MCSPFPSLSGDFRGHQESSLNKFSPSLFGWLECCLQCGCSNASISDLPLLICKDGNSVVNWGRKIVSFYSLLCSAENLEKALIWCLLYHGIWIIFKSRGTNSLVNGWWRIWFVTLRLAAYWCLSSFATCKLTTELMFYVLLLNSTKPFHCF